MCRLQDTAPSWQRHFRCTAYVVCLFPLSNMNMLTFSKATIYAPWGWYGPPPFFGWTCASVRSVLKHSPCGKHYPPFLSARSPKHACSRHHSIGARIRVNCNTSKLHAIRLEPHSVGSPFDSLHSPVDCFQSAAHHIRRQHGSSHEEIPNSE